MPTIETLQKSNGLPEANGGATDKPCHPASQDRILQREQSSDGVDEAASRRPEVDTVGSTRGGG